MPKKYKFEKTFTYEGKRYHVYGDTEREVYERMALKRRDLEEGRVVINKQMSVKKWTDICVDTYKVDISERTRQNIQSIINKHILPYIGNMSISAVKPVMCQKILNNLSGFSKSYIIKTHQILSFIFRTAKENELVISDPTVSLVRPEGHTTHRRTITPDERRHLLEVCSADHRLIPFLFMLYCGCRPSEALNVRSDDICSIDDVRALHIRGTKTVNADRYVPIPLEFLPTIDECDPGGTGLFASKLDGHPHTEASYKQLSKHLKRMMNISMGANMYRNRLIPPLPLADDFSAYCLRHTYCTDLKKAGVPLSIAKDYMGHADISTTANIYSHYDDDTFLKGASILGIKK